MTGSTSRTIKTPRGDFVMRPETPEDEPFLFRLFVSHNVGMLRLAGLPEDVIEKMITLQFRSQTSTYRRMYPDAIYSIVEVGGEAIGRFIEHDETDVVYFVDFLLFPENRTKGLGSALTRALMQEWAAKGRGTRVTVLMNNVASLTMCRKLGFTETPEANGYIDMHWYPKPSG
jgi:RimJ/RimL family protein N-acetyltransferase